MITRQTKLQLVVFGIVAIFGLLFTGGRYAGLGTLVPGNDPGYLVNADFSDSGGIFKGAEVTQRGVPVGKVEDLQLVKDGVRLKLRLRPGTTVPTPTRAQVGNRSAVGEQFVDLIPQSDSGTNALRSGSVIPVSMTGIPIQPTQLVVNLDRLVRSVDVKDVGVVLDELGKAFYGAGDDLQRLVDAGDQLTAAATANLTQTKQLIRDSTPVLNTQRDVSGQFKSYNRDLAALTSQLRASDPDFRALFANGTDSAVETTSLLEANRAALPVLLDNLVFAAQVQAVRIPALRQILVTYPNVVAGGFTVTPGDGTAHFGLATTKAPPPCRGRGYQPVPVPPNFFETSNKPAYLNAYCDQPKGSTVNVRGAGNDPRAEGLPPFPQDTAAGNQPFGSKASLFAGTAGTDGFTTMPADYDPSTGHTTTADGKQYVVSSTAGAAAVFGSDSWEWLLLDPLRHS